MKKLRSTYTLLYILLLTVCTACTQNNGYIGSLFGTWALTSMTVNGETPKTFKSDDTFWSFQNTIINVQQVADHYQYVSHYGTWEESDGQLLLNFTHSDDVNAAGEGPYLAPTWIGFPKNEIVELTYVTKKSRHMELTWTNRDGDVFYYILTKTY